MQQRVNVSFPEATWKHIEEVREALGVPYMSNAALIHVLTIIGVKHVEEEAKAKKKAAK
jgi:hypothetical protein